MMLDTGTRPLANFPFLASRDVEQVRDRVAQVYCSHRLEPFGQGRQVDAWQNIAKLSRMSVGAMSYGGDVTVEPGRLENFFLAMLPYKGAANIDISKSNVLFRADPSVGTLLSPTDPVRMDWSADCAKMMVRIDRQSLETQLSTVLDRPLREPLRFEAAMPLRGRSAAWWRFVYLLVDELEASDPTAGRTATIAQIEALLMTSLLEGQPHNYTEAMRNGDGRVLPRHVRKAKLYIEEHAGEPIGIDDIVLASGVSGRALYEGFQRFCDVSPMAYLRNVRMTRAHGDLKGADEGVTVAQIAVRWGFFEFGRFAGQYRKIYGETPSQTLKNRH